METKQGRSVQEATRETTNFYKTFAANGGELYLAEIKRFAVGLYDPMVKNLINSLAIAPQSSILDLGCGVGNIEEEILTQYPDSHITCVDNTPEMIEATRERLERFETQPTLMCVDILSLQPEKSFSTVFSNLAIHNLSIAEKKRLLTKIQSWLEANGTFVWGDFMEFEDKKLGEQIMKERKKAVLQSDGADPNFVHEILDKESEDERLTMTETIALLTEIGFTNVETVWHEKFLAVLKCKI